MSDTSSTSGGGSFLAKKAGPFTGQTWLIIVGGTAIVGFMVYRKLKTGTTGTPLTTDSFTNPNATSIPSQAGGGSSGTVSTANGNPSTFTNAQWALNASNGLIASGDDPTTVSNALSKYMNGTQLSAAEAAIVAVAITTYGEPPQGVLPVNSGSASGSGSSSTGYDPIVSVLQDGVRMFQESAAGVVSYIGNPTQAAAALQSTGQTGQGFHGSGQSIYSDYVTDPSGALWGLSAYTTPSVAGNGGTTAGQWHHLNPQEWAGLGNPFGRSVSAAPTSVSGTAHTYTALTGDTLANISQRFLGTSDTSKVIAANPGLHDPISPGTVISIPANG